MSRPAFVPLPRCVLSADWWRQASLYQRNLWVTLMGLVNWTKGTTRRGETVHPGQTITSWRALAELSAFTDDNGKRIVPSVGKCRRAADYLKKAREVTWKPTGKAAACGILLTLTRWAFYNGMTGEAADPPAGEAAYPSAGYPAPIEEEYRDVPFRTRPRRSTLDDVKTWERKAREDKAELDALCKREGRVQ